jgi:hypothetical protein
LELESEWESEWEWEWVLFAGDAPAFVCVANNGGNLVVQLELLPATDVPDLIGEDSSHAMRQALLAIAGSTLLEAVRQCTCLGSMVPHEGS